LSIDYSNMMFPKGSKTVLRAKPKDISKTNREEIKKLFKGKCGLCGQAGVHIHHIIYKSEDRNKIDDFNNLILLCLECHQKVHSNKKYWQPRLMKLREKIGEEKKHELC
jgi:5-methylcytosine-specific restriction endonuclease McrA